MKKLCFIFFNLLFFWGLVAGKSAVTKLKKYVFIFFRLIFFGGLAAGKSATKKWTKCMFFFGVGREGWLRKNRRKKTEQKKQIYIYIYTYVYFFGRLVAGKSAAKKLNKYNIYIFFLRAGHGKLGDIIKLFWFVLRRSHQKKARKKNLPAILLSFFKRSYVAWIWAQKTSA